MLLFNLLAFSWTGLFFFVLAGPITIWIHYVIARTILLLVRTSYAKRWRWNMRMPWLGYIPDQHFSFRMFVRVHLNMSLDWIMYHYSMFDMVAIVLHPLADLLAFVVAGSSLICCNGSLPRAQRRTHQIE